MTAPRPETNVRLTDIVADFIANRLGTSGTGLADDLVSKINQALGFPLEVSPASTPDSTLNISGASYTLPNAERIGVLDGTILSSLAAGVIDFAAGTISTGANPTFVLPNMVAGNYVRALIQVKPDTGAINVSFGTQNAVLASAGIPAIIGGYSAIYLVELHSTAGGTGSFDAITRAALVRIAGGLKTSAGAAPYERQSIGAPTSTINLTQIVIPQDRKRLKYSLNGVRQYETLDYTVVNDTQISTVQPVIANAELLFEID